MTKYQKAVVLNIRNIVYLFYLSEVQLMLIVALKNKLYSSKINTKISLSF